MTKKTNSFCIKYSYIPLIVMIFSVALTIIFKIKEFMYIGIPSAFLFFIMFFMLGVFPLYATNYKKWYDQYDGLIIGWGVTNPFILMEYFIISDLDDNNEENT